MYKRIMINATPEIHNQLQSIALKENRTLANLILTIIKEYLAARKT